MIDEFLTFFIAGADTTVNAICKTFRLLLINFQ